MKDDYQAIMVTPKPKHAFFQQMKVTPIQLPNQLLSTALPEKQFLNTF